MSTASRDFWEDLASSKAQRQDSDIDTLRALFPTCKSVVKTTEKEDKTGTDYIVTLRRGAQITVDAKTRNPGCSDYWQAGPEVALEFWSVMPGGRYKTPWEKRATGWALDEAKEVDLILFTFDPADHRFAYIRSLPLLRETFRRNYDDWLLAYRHEPPQRTRKGPRFWESQCVFVPLIVVDQAIEAMSRRQEASLCPGFVSMTSTPFTAR